MQGRPATRAAQVRMQGRQTPAPCPDGSPCLNLGPGSAVARVRPWHVFQGRPAYSIFAFQGGMTGSCAAFRPHSRSSTAPDATRPSCTRRYAHANRPRAPRGRACRRDRLARAGGGAAHTRRSSATPCATGALGPGVWTAARPDRHHGSPRPPCRRATRRPDRSTPKTQRRCPRGLAPRQARRGSESRRPPYCRGSPGVSCAGSGGKPADSPSRNGRQRTSTWRRVHQKSGSWRTASGSNR